MKSFIIVGLCLVAIASAQKDGADPNCDPSKMPKVTPESCCPGYPDFKKASFIQTCGKQCFGNQADKNDKKEMMCCMSKCFLTETKSINADGTFNSANIVSTIVSNSAAKDKTKYQAFATKVVETCISNVKAKASEKTANKNYTMCPAAHLEGCIMRNLFLDCPDATASKDCTDLQAFAKTCKRFPMMMGRQGGPKPNGGKTDGTQQGPPKKPEGAKPAGDAKKPSGDANKKQENSKATGAPKKPEGAKPSAAPERKQEKAKSTAAPEKKKQEKAKAKHPSETEHGTLGADGAGFKDV